MRSQNDKPKLPQPGWGIRPREFLTGWWNVLTGRPPLLSIEITRECPLNCPGCYAYAEQHLGVGGPTLRDVSDFRGEALVRGVLDLVRKHKPVHVSLVGGEPMVRWKELSRILPVLGDMGVHTLLVTSAVIPIPKEWMAIPRLRVAVSVDGLPEHHDVRRKPATYERILRNIEQCMVNIHWTITRPMLRRASYLEEYIDFWSRRAEVNRIWASVYSPQVGEHTPEMLTREDRENLAVQLPKLRRRYPKFLINDGIAKAFLQPPQTPAQCMFSRMSLNYTADLATRVEPCVLGGIPDCSQCGCAASVGLHWVKSVKLAGPLRVDHLLQASIRIGRAVRRVHGTVAPIRWQASPDQKRNHSALVQIRTPRQG
jgi:MoaA/NifB/PqqE/SkfB family radical SAM enzyme